MKAKSLVSIFDKCIDDYHKFDNVNQEIINPFEKNSFEGILYRKCWIDTVQWHYEDIIRDDEIKPKDALDLKRKIDQSNQKRTNLVEVIDDYFMNEFKEVNPQKNATMNTESIAWAIDRLSILALKIYHMLFPGKDLDWGYPTSNIKWNRLLEISIMWRQIFLILPYLLARS